MLGLFENAEAPHHQALDRKGIAEHPLPSLSSSGLHDRIWQPLDESHKRVVFHPLVVPWTEREQELAPECLPDLQQFEQLP